MENMDNKETQVGFEANEDLVLNIEALRKVVNGETPLLEAFFIACKYHAWSANTKKNYEYHMQNFVSFLVLNKVDPLLKNVDLPICKAWQKNLKGRLGKKDTTIDNAFRALRSILRFYHQIGILAQNPFELIKITIESQDAHSRHLTVFEQKLVYLAVEKLKQEGFDIEFNVKFALVTAARVNTLNAVKVQHINFENKTVKLRQSRKNSLEMPLSPTMVKLIQKHIDTHNLKAEDHLLRNLKGEPLQNKQFNYMIKRLCQKLGWEGEKVFSPHGFRYTLATHLDSKGASDHVIQLSLSHSSKGNMQTTKRYIHNKSKTLEELRLYIHDFDAEFEEFASRNRPLLKGVSTVKQLAGILEEQALFQESMQKDVNIQALSQAIDLIKANPGLLHLSNTSPAFSNNSNFVHYLNGSRF
ncbi:tyrosine-type recombinase/integrase [Domibacillus indicus]|uniref:tyrosine-type recombinase/integrase n=1 Tax=Domibacillus indicus TaxID=1437523 RepID=UPI000618021B|nr:site-specific integrase [Domibacillus indicus]